MIATSVFLERRWYHLSAARCASQLMNEKYLCKNALIGAFDTPTSNGFLYRLQGFSAIKHIPVGRATQAAAPGFHQKLNSKTCRSKV